METKDRFVIGIDSGTTTGFAIWNRSKKLFAEISSLPIHRALDKVRAMHEQGYQVEVIVEDARLANKGRRSSVDANKLQGAGSIKRDAAIWESFLKDHKIPHQMVRPCKAITKYTAEEFKRTTGYAGSTNGHSRDAAMIVYDY